ncbi:MAG: class I SAM-dependent methyltransferase [Planctomycetes bacterium]|nr:class I SAM-dependent methyltransferase [Planctomycetota bacterium]
MSIIEEYKRQFAWRPWGEIFAALPDIRNQIVVDLGCAVGDQSAELIRRGAFVIGLDANEEMLAEARRANPTNAEFRTTNLLQPLTLKRPVDGIWCSFAAAFFVDLSATLGSWLRCLRPGGWIALTEIDDLFGHKPVSARTRELLDAYAADGLAARRYDFHMGSKLRGAMEGAGLSVRDELRLSDRELAFDGPAEPAVLEAWRLRLDRMKLLHDFCGREYEGVRDDFLSCLGRPDHQARARVVFCLGFLE